MIANQPHVTNDWHKVGYQIKVKVITEFQSVSNPQQSNPIPSIMWQLEPFHVSQRFGFNLNNRLVYLYCLSSDILVCSPLPFPYICLPFWRVNFKMIYPKFSSSRRPSQQGRSCQEMVTLLRKHSHKKGMEVSGRSIFYMGADQPKQTRTRPL